MIINHNISAIFTHRNLKMADYALAADTEKLSSGMRINRAGDDAAGLAVSEKMRTQILGLKASSKKHRRWDFFYSNYRRLYSTNSRCNTKN